MAGVCNSDQQRESFQEWKRTPETGRQQDGRMFPNLVVAQEIMDEIWKNTQKEEENTKELQNISVLTLKKPDYTSQSVKGNRLTLKHVTFKAVQTTSLLPYGATVM